MCGATDSVIITANGMRPKHCGDKSCQGDVRSCINLESMSIFGGCMPGGGACYVMNVVDRPAQPTATTFAVRP